MSSRVDVAAWEPPGIVPLEIWDTSIDGRTLFERREEPSFYEVLVRAIASIPSTSSARRVVVVGGGVDRARASAAFDARFDLALVSEDPFFAAAGALEHADVIVDVGQTSVKAVSTRGRVRVERTGGSVPVATITMALTTVGDHSAPARVVVALPCAITARDGRILLGESSYPFAGDASSFVDALVEGAAMPIASIRLVNDAVLAAHVARDHVERVRAPTLVLTIGHGVGAALVEGERE